MNIFKKIWSRRYVASLTKNEWPIIIEKLVSASGGLSEAFFSGCVESVRSNSDIKDANIINSTLNQESQNILKGFLSLQMLRYIKVANYITQSEYPEFVHQFMATLSGDKLEAVEEFYKKYEELFDNNELPLSSIFLTDLFETIVDKKCPIDIAFYFLSQPTYELFKNFTYLTVSDAFKDKYECEYVKEAGKKYYRNYLYAEYMKKLGL